MNLVEEVEVSLYNHWPVIDFQNNNKFNRSKQEQYKQKWNASSEK